ncbi:RNA 3'-terminal phosphate cyclase [Vibrio mangrovi]|uniref:RNA 3'-terminal phosphate cyclase n=1 Tax=Vibrio mangrovi TaxID=474394 RepID=A0A1Y6IYQ3_9VIBR|nr:RNA 3'-terminal phosphate cyclase [Vibrio mangrovi]MDW6002510.1 RNA 3'-terminal phosphate cyclase [Vibrio mangrovi]SMS01960.1 RNA 3'-terminal phosphate cyclase [Vibrio mangrovi]
MKWIEIDGSQGEGGGQVLRSALTLSMLYRQPVEIRNIRAGRKKPGLLRQHLTCVQAAKDISQARCEGDSLGSTSVRFAPGAICPGEYQFAVGSAGSTVLVCQTILLPLVMTGQSATVEFEGGTHNGLSPSLTFFQDAFLAVLKQMGIHCEVQVASLGFNPAGGGRWRLSLFPTSHLEPFQLEQPGADFAQLPGHRRIRVIMSDLPSHIAEREIEATRKKLGWDETAADIHWVTSSCSGNSLHLSIDCGTYLSMFEAVGQYGTSAERVARRSAGKLQSYLRSGAAIEEHLADQLLLPMIVAGSGRFTTTRPSQHTLTNIDVIRQMTGVNIQVVPLDEELWEIVLEENHVSPQ